MLHSHLLYTESHSYCVGALYPLPALFCMCLVFFCLYHFAVNCSFASEIVVFCKQNVWVYLGLQLSDRCHLEIVENSYPGSRNLKLGKTIDFFRAVIVCTFYCHTAVQSTKTCIMHEEKHADHNISVAKNVAATPKKEATFTWQIPWANLLGKGTSFRLTNSLWTGEGNEM